MPGKRQSHRNNHYGLRSLRDTGVVRSFYSAIQSGKIVNVEPAAYLRKGTQRAIR